MHTLMALEQKTADLVVFKRYTDADIISKLESTVTTSREQLLRARLSMFENYVVRCAVFGEGSSPHENLRKRKILFGNHNYDSTRAVHACLQTHMSKCLASDADDTDKDKKEKEKDKKDKRTRTSDGDKVDKKAAKKAK
jgi:hypothetical protein